METIRATIILRKELAKRITDLAAKEGLSFNEWSINAIKARVTEIERFNTIKDKLTVRK